MEQREQFQQTFGALYSLSKLDKIEFLEDLLAYFPLAGRAIWSDDELSDAEKAEALKWLNELTHRVWNLRSDLQRGEEDDCVDRLYANMKFYGGLSRVLRSHLVPTTILAFNRLKEKK